MSYRNYMVKQRIADFEMLIGALSEDAIRYATAWANVNIANARDTQAQKLVEYFVEFHTALIRRPNFTGVIEPSAWLANERALQLARDATKRSKIICSNLTHISIKQSCSKLGLETVIVDADPKNNYQVQENELSNAVRNQKDDIAAIVSTHGTTQLGNVENMAKYPIIQELRENGSWLHIDAAFGGVLTQVSSLRNVPIPESDTITLDPYKFLGVPGAALLIVKEDKLHPSKISYYDHSKFTVYSTFSAFPVAAWFKSVQDFGERAGMRELADECIKNSCRFAEDLRLSNMQLIRNPATIIVPVKTRNKQETKCLRDYLHTKGYNVGRLEINGKTYESNGIRIACTPRQWTFRGLADLQEMRGEIIKYLDSQKRAVA